MAAGETLAEGVEESPWIGTQKARRIRRPHTLYTTVIRTYLKRADHRIVKLTDIRIALDTAYAGLLLEKSDAYVDYAHRLRDPVECRRLKGETIPQDEKIFSVFEPHTRWIAKGPDRRLPAPRWNFGVPVCILEDQYPFILGHTILSEGGDRDCIVPLVGRVKQDVPHLDTLSLDTGFWSPAVHEALSSTLALAALPKKGRPTADERAREQIPEFTAARQQHPAIESAINMLEHHGLQRIRSFGP